MSAEGPERQQWLIVWNCGICDVDFATEDLIKVHMQEKHPEERGEKRKREEEREEEKIPEKKVEKRRRKRRRRYK